MTKWWDKMTTGDSHVEGTQEFFAPVALGFSL